MYVYRVIQSRVPTVAHARTAAADKLHQRRRAPRQLPHPPPAAPPSRHCAHIPGRLHTLRAATAAERHRAVGGGHVAAATTAAVRWGALRTTAHHCEAATAAA